MVAGAGRSTQHEVDDARASRALDATVAVEMIDAPVPRDAPVAPSIDDAVDRDEGSIDSATRAQARVNNDNGCCSPSQIASCAACFNRLDAENVCETGPDSTICLACGYPSSL